MIELTRLNGSKFSVNCDLIKYVEAAPDTTLTLVSGEKLLVMEAREMVVELILQHRSLVLRKAWPEGVAAANAGTGFDALYDAHEFDQDDQENASFSLTR